VPAGFEFEAPQQQPSAVTTFLKSAYDNSLGPLVGLGKDLYDYYEKKTLAQKAVANAGGPMALLVDAASDPAHPLHKLGKNIIDSAIDQGKQAINFGGDAALAEKAALQAIIRGDLNEAAIHSQNAEFSAMQAAGHGLAAIVPGVGPAAAQAGTDIGEGNFAKGGGAAAGLLGTVLLPKAIKGAKGAVGTVGESVSRGAEVASDTAAKVKNAVGETMTKATTETAPLSKLQPELQAATKGAAAEAADSAAVKPASTPTIRETFTNTAKSIFEKSKGLYKQIDAATNGAWQTNDNAIKVTSRKIRQAVDEEVMVEAQAHLDDLYEQQKEIFQQAVDNGVPAETVEAARASYRQGSALEDLQAQINQSTTGRAGLSQAGEVVDPGKLQSRLHKMYDAGRLQDALGETNAQKLIRAVEQAGKQRVVSLPKILKAAGWATGGAYGLSKLFGGGGER
jgi:hypothetical protein